MSIEIKVIQQSPMQAKGANSVRGYLSTASNVRSDMTFINPLGVELTMKAQSDIPLVLTQLAQRDLDFQDDDYLATFERKNLLKLKAENKLSTKIRDSGMPSNEWDSWIVSFKAPNADTVEAIKKVIIQEFRSAKVIEKIDINGNPAPGQFGTNGARAMFISEEHSTDGTHVHFHIITHMHAIDPLAHEVSVKMDFSKSGLVETFRQRINSALKQGGIDANIHFDGTSKDASNNAITDKARKEIADLDLDRTDNTENTDTETLAKAAIREVNTAPRDMVLNKAFEQLEKEVLRETTERLRIEQSLAQKHGQLQSMKLAMEAIANEAALKSEVATKTIALENATVSLTEATASIVELNVTIESVQKEAQEATASAQFLKGELLDVGTFLCEHPALLNLNDNEKASLVEGKGVGDVVQSAIETYAGFIEALEQCPVAFVNAIHNDVTVLPLLLDELEQARKDVPDLHKKISDAAEVAKQQKATIEQLEQRLTAEQTQLSATNKELGKLEVHLENAQGELTQAKVRETELGQEIAQGKEREAGLAGELVQAKAREAELGTQLRQLLENKEVQDAQVKDLMTQAIEQEEKVKELEKRPKLTGRQNAAINVITKLNLFETIKKVGTMEEVGMVPNFSEQLIAAIEKICDDYRNSTGLNTPDNS